METIRFGIDLGTTNSLISRFENGKLDIFKNPVGFKETLPSCVAFRGNRIMVGDKAREWITKDPLNVFSSFKRKMGTSEVYFSPTRMESFSPVQLSAFVLKELLNFIHGSDVPKSVVVTIPASFDTVQSNATKEAGYEAGFKEVVLLQEPIAASLAFFNNPHGIVKDSGSWIVYDLGGGTFDTAVVKIQDGEMKILDHQGNNYLGGVDLDFMIVKNLILPELHKQTGLPVLKEDIALRSGIYETLYYILMLKAEDAKKELTVADSSIVDIDLTLTDGTIIEAQIELFRSDFESLISDTIDQTIDMMDEVLKRCGMQYQSIEEVILIGGSTLIPLVSKRIRERTACTVNNTADPTTAVAVGAAYYAGAKPAKYIEDKIPTNNITPSDIQVKTAWNKNTRDKEEYISIEVSGIKPGYKYRISRLDGGFDTGFLEASSKFGEFVPLRDSVVNLFSLRIYDENLIAIYELENPIEIVQGIYNLYGQPLPEDISIEVDDPENNSTRCELIFARNSILPLQKTVYKEISRYIKKSSDESLIFQLLEGDHKSHPATNKVIGAIELNASKLASDLIKGSEVEIKISISESRDIEVNVHLGFTNEEFHEVFTPSQRTVSLVKLKEDLKQLCFDLDHVVNKFSMNEQFEEAGMYSKYLNRAESLNNEINQLHENDASDLRYKAEAEKREIAKILYQSDRAVGRTQQTLEDYYNWKSNMEYWCLTLDDVPQNYKDEFNELKEYETSQFPITTFLVAKNIATKINKLVTKTIVATPTLLVQFFMIYAAIDETGYTDPARASQLLKKGEKAMESNNFTELKAIFMQLLGIAKNSDIDDVIKGTGLK